jgi:hypothetical protein
MSTLYHPPPIPWTQFPGECFWYLYPFMGVLHLVMFIVGCIILLMLSRKQSGTLKRRIGHFGLFMILLLFVGAFFNGLWSCLIWGRLYCSIDYVCDFTPFWPITQSVIDDSFGDSRGQLYGVSLSQLQCVWLLFAAGAWAVTIFLYRLIRHRPPPNQSPEPIASAATVPIHTPRRRWLSFGR